MLNKDFREFFQLLNSHEVRYLVVGGYAVAAHGHPRYTKDIDVWLDRAEENRLRLMEALTQFGFGSVGLQAQDFAAPDQIVQLGYPPRRIDLLTSVSGLSFDDAFPRRVLVTVDGVDLSIIDKSSLITNKRASGRLQDLADIEALGEGVTTPDTQSEPHARKE